ncbi:hypothetical protein Pla8534_37610 [Lignipirellula cremea]|uniref:Uncharacterized protein n=2 Tax=Lignipirellula cremea TaxID=2528010 RepID=A0A518DVS8_9BACT|nr:hypothetical protein Pla8534_37610 [Lignipirellula cremea]
MNEQPPEHSETDAYSRKLTRTAFAFAVFGVMGALITIGIQYSSVDSFSDAKALFLSPFTFGAAGWFLGFSFAFLCAPTSYLQSPSGQKWMELVGTNSISGARVVCAVLTMITVGFFGVLVWATITGQF